MRSWVTMSLVWHDLRCSRSTGWIEERTLVLLGPFFPFLFIMHKPWLNSDEMHPLLFIRVFRVTSIFQPWLENHQIRRFVKQAIEILTFLSRKLMASPTTVISVPATSSSNTFWANPCTDRMDAPTYSQTMPRHIQNIPHVSVIPVPYLNPKP